MKVGDEYYDACVDPHEGTIILDLWVITKVTIGVVFAIRKSKWTWVKVSKTNGDYGWAPNISDYDRKRFKAADGPPKDWARTKAAAYTKALPEVEAAIKRLTKIRATITGQRTKARKP